MKQYLVGGAVRDKLLGKEPKDRDWVIVGATQEDVDSLLAQGYTQVGADFPVFLHPETKEEYAFARIERKVGVGYHGFEVSTESVTIEEDLARRDLTINSMAMDEDGKIVDPYGGRKDLHNRVLRHTTDAFAEDPLRVMRLARFAARFPEWRVHPSTIELCKKLTQAGELNHLSIERIWTEMEKGFAEAAPQKFMQVLSQTEALLWTDSLKSIFGSVLTEVQAAISQSLACVPKDQRLYVAIGALARVDSDVPGGPSRARDCQANVLELKTSKRTAEDLARIIKKARGLQDGPQFMDLVMAATAIERAGWKLTFSAKRLMTAQRIMREIRASDFPGLEGKELGRMIDETRVANLQMGLDIPTPCTTQQLG